MAVVDMAQPLWLIASAGAFAVAIFALPLMGGSEQSSKRYPDLPRRVVPSPMATLLPHLSKAEISRLAYSPDILPGNRKVATPYGSMNVYEWGPEAGRKVLFVHGDATPSPLFRPIAHELVAKGCRVMIFDLWGRGYSDTPADCQHNSALYSMQILYALHSSPVAWTGQSVRFSLVGFSMGASISLDFFNHHPALIEGIILLGPGGLIRNLPVEYQSIWFKYPSVISEYKLRRLIGALLGIDTGKRTLPEGDFTPAKSLQFQFDYHEGHVQSFFSTIKYGPLQHQEAIWETAAKTLRTNTIIQDILVICGDSDSVVPAEDVQEDLAKYFHGATNFTFRTVPGGHGFPWSEGNTIAEYIADFWGL